MFCVKCGKQLNDGMVFCPYCGTKITSEVPRQTAPPQAAGNMQRQAAPPQAANNMPHQTFPGQTVDKKSSKAKFVIIAAAVLALFAIIYLRMWTPTLSESLSGTWIASFGGGEYECRLHFSDSGDAGAAMLVRFNKTGECIGYFEIIYRGEVTFSDTRESKGTKETSGIIRLENISNKENHDHDYELPYMTIHYTYNPKTRELTLDSNFLSNYFNDNVDTDLTFTEHLEYSSYYPDTGVRYYDWYFLN